MSGAVEIRGNKTMADLGHEAGWFVLHTFLAVVVLAIVVGGISAAHPDALSDGPKLLCTCLAFLVPMVGGYAICTFFRNHIARYIWISALVTFSLVCVWVLDLPTGNGLCNDCGAVDKLWRTFFSIDHGSGLMGGDGVLLGAWLPLSMIGYSVGARLSPAPEDEEFSEFDEEFLDDQSSS